jgi:hypothetical protein
MRVVALASAAALLTAAAPAPQLSQSDFQQLVKAVVLESSTTARINNAGLVCVQQEFAPPLEVSELGALMQGATTGNAALDKSITAALARGSVAPQTKFSSVPHASVALPSQVTPRGNLLRFVLLSPRSPDRSSCVIDRQIFGPRPSANRTLPFVLTLTRPVIVSGVAFIKHSFDCPGLCGSGQIYVFKKRNGKWTHVASGDFWVS